MVLMLVENFIDAIDSIFDWTGLGHYCLFLRRQAMGRRANKGIWLLYQYHILLM